ncbi:MAG TPA: TetR/AcrR family transcriptional regulator [Polyangiaceae bacterium]|jgi:AcrR family transcriptional regulator
MPKRSSLAPRVQKKRPGQYHHGELRRALLDATLAIVGREGTGALSLRAVARRVGVSPQASYNHFADRAALLEAAAEEGLRELARGMRSARDGARAAGERLEATGLAYVAFAVSHRAHFRLFSAPDLVEQRTRPLLSAAYAEAFGVVLGAVEDAQKANVVRAGNARKLALTAWATVHGLAWLVVDGQLAIAGVEGEPGEVARAAVRVLFKGLAG